MEHDTFEFELVQPTYSQKMAVLWVDVEGVEGNFVVGPGHADIVSLLKIGSKLRYRTDGQQEAAVDVVSGGIIYVTGGRAVALLDH